MSASRRYLGHPDADADAHFAEYFVHSRELRKISSSDSDVVFGAKGVGKTALRRALTEIKGSIYAAHHTVSLDTVSFTQVHEALKGLSATSKADISTLARNLWQNVIAVFSLEAAAKSSRLRQTLVDEIEGFLEEQAFDNSSPNQRILGVVDRILDLVANIAVEHPANSALGLNRQQRQILNEFPYHQRLLELIREVTLELEPDRRKLVLCLDGFDSIVDHSPESRRAIFAGLVDAVRKFALDARLNEAYCFKVFLPQELADVARPIHWDEDKHVAHTHFVSWGQEQLERFIAKRLAPYSRTKSTDFSNLWHEVFPDKVRNTVHRIEEASFGYIVRHTLYRPRHLLEHVQALLDEWDESRAATRIDPTFIPAVVARTSKTLADLTIKQLEIANPGTQAFLLSWRGQSSTLTLGAIRVRLAKFFGLRQDAEINLILDFLYDFGVIGFAKKDSLKPGNQLSKFVFGSLSDHMSAGMHGLVEEDDIIAISPMMQNFCDSQPSEFGAIIPVSI